MSIDLETGVRQRLLDAAVGLLGEGGPEGTTLRAIARRAGVSHGAPARHFLSLVALLSEVAAEGFCGLEASVEASAAAASAAAGDDPRMRLAAGGRGYVSFALGNPGVFSLMWRSDLVDFSQPALAEAGASAFASLRHLVEAYQRRGWRKDLDTDLLAGSLWAAVHGMAQLWLFGVLAPTSGAASIDELSEVAFALLLADDCPTFADPHHPSLRHQPATTENRPRRRRP